MKLGLHPVPVLTSVAERALRVLSAGMRLPSPPPPPPSSDDDVFEQLRKVACP